MIRIIEKSYHSCHKMFLKYQILIENCSGLHIEQFIYKKIPYCYFMRFSSQQVISPCGNRLRIWGVLITSIYAVGVLRTE